MMLTLSAYFGPRMNHPEATAQMYANAEGLCRKVNALLDDARADGAYTDPVDSDTGTCVSGSPPREHMSGDGGFRSQDAKTGASRSAHKQARGVDLFDPLDPLDEWLDQFEGANGYNSKLEEHGLYREAPHATPGWCHLQDVAPGSGRRTFNP